MDRLLVILSGLLNVYLTYGLPTAAGPTVTLNYGSFQGETILGNDQFLGIPFAQAERFGLPQAPAPLTGVQQATSFGAACPQQAFPPAIIPGLPPLTSPNLTTSEDCLFINVIRPAGTPPNASLPVLFWIYGGSFEVGDTSLNDGSTVVARSVALGEPVIYVSANYRVNAFGFSGSKEIKAAGVGNLGLRDQRFALQWVQKNIGLFGGDKTKVTIWGESAGAFSTGLHLVVDGGNQKGLFRGAFMESGSPNPLGDITDGQPFFDQLVADTGCSGSADPLACLKGVPLPIFQAAVDKSPSWSSFMSLQLVWKPRIDGDFIVENPQDSIVKGAFSKVPLVNGDCDDEGTLFSLSQLNLTTDQEAADYLRTHYFPAATPEQFQPLTVLYPSDPVTGSPFDTGEANQLTPEFKRIAAFQGDVIFQAPRRFFLQAASKRQDVWSFVFKRGKTASVLGAFHSTDLAEFYGAAAGTTPPGFQGTDALVNFANHLDPNFAARNENSTLISWPKYSASVTAPPLLTFLDPNELAITADTFRDAAMQALTNLSRQFPS